jgi:hypothetical protein
MKKPTSQHILLKVTTVILLTILIIGGFYKLGIIKKNCHQDNQCFSEKLKKCSYARYNAIINNNYYEYAIKGNKKDTCVLHIKLKKMGSGTPLDQIELFEGKEMTCYIPEENLNLELEDINNLLNHCTGPLKEAIYEHIITKMYGLVLKNMNPIIKELDKTVKQ